MLAWKLGRAFRSDRFDFEVNMGSPLMSTSAQPTTRGTRARVARAQFWIDRARRFALTCSAPSSALAWPTTRVACERSVCIDRSKTVATLARDFKRALSGDRFDLEGNIGSPPISDLARPTTRVRARACGACPMLY
eukprot:6953371-Pyramimonas_sp.AAC.1